MKFIFSLIFLFLSFPARAIEVLAPHAPQGANFRAEDITDQVDISVQPSEKDEFQNFEYKPNSSKDLKLRYTDKALWIRLQLHNPTDSAVDRLIYLTSSLAGYLELFSDSDAQGTQLTGSSVPFHARSYKSRLPVFRIHLDPGESKKFYIKRVSHHNLSSKIYLGSPEALATEEATAQSVLYFYVGGIICLILYNFFIGVFAKDFNYFLYAFFAAAVAAAALNTQGFFDSYLFPSLNFSISHYLMVFSSVAVLSCLVFAYRFLNIAQVLPEAKPGFLVFGLSGLVTFGLGFFPVPGTQVVFGHLIDITIIMALLFLVGCGVIVFKRGYKLARFFLLSWISLVIGVFGWFGMTYGLFHHSTITSHALMFGNMGEMIILSLGLAYKINILDQEKRKALYQAQEKERFHRLVKVLTHDVANAISIFGGYLVRLKRAMKDHPEIATVSKLEAAIDNMKGILDLVRGEEAFNSFRLSVSLRTVDLYEVVNEILSFYEEQIAKKNLKLRVNIPESCCVLADKTALANQVLSNLMSNAIKFSHPNSEIELFVEKDREHTILKIQDHGIGIQREEIQKIFFSGEISSRPGTMKERGTGIGTSLVKEYMAIFKGRIEVTSVHESTSQQSGTTISLYFPQVH